MAFMKPEYHPGPFYMGETEHGEGVCGPVEVWGSPEAFARDTGATLDSVKVERGWFFRLSAPGYLDCTEWDGPHGDIANARMECERIFDVDAETGDDLHAEDQETAEDE